MSRSIDNSAALEIVEQLRQLLILLDLNGFHEAAIDVNQAIEKMSKQIEVPEGN